MPIHSGVEGGFDYEGWLLAGAVGFVAGEVGQYFGGTYQNFANAASLSSGTVAVGSSIVSGVTGAVAGSIFSQGVNIALGRQERFSWRGVAASAVSGAISSGVSLALGGTGDVRYGGQPGSREFSSWGLLTETGARFAGNVAARSVEIWLEGHGKYDFAMLAADAFGNALGNSIVGHIEWSGRSTTSKSTTIPEPSIRPLTEADLMPDAVNLDPLDLMPRINFAPEAETYTVKAGDSLSKIMGTSDPAVVGALMRENGLTNSTIQPGQVLTLPSSGYTGEDAALGQAALDIDNARLEKKKVLASLTVVDRGGDTGEILSELSRLPTHVLRQLHGNGVSWAAVDQKVGEYQDSGSRIARGYENQPGRARVNDLPAAYIPESKTVVIASNPIVRHGSVNEILHETGHAFNAVTGSPATSAEFKIAYDKDKSSLGDYYIKAGNKKGYLSETFAESFAAFYSGSAEYAQRHPNLYNYWQERP